MICPHCGCDTDKPVVRYEFLVIMEEMNRILGTKYRWTNKLRDLISARYREGFRTEDFIQVCKTMKREWGNDPSMSIYLRPITLFSNKMDSYLNRVQPELKKNNGLPENVVW